LLDSLIEHPEVILPSVPYGKFSHIFGINRVFCSLLSDEPALRQPHRSGVSANAVGVFVNNAG
jgi:hypothetical protein